MNNQGQTQEEFSENTSPEPSSSNKLIASVILTFLVTALVVGGGVFAWQNKKLSQVKKEKDNEIKKLQEEVITLEEEIESLEEAKKNAAPKDLPDTDEREDTDKTSTKEESFCSNSKDKDSVTKLNGDTVYCDNYLQMWTITADKKMEWSKAKEYCENLAYGGFSDWSLPDCKSSDNLPSSCTLYQFGKSACNWTSGWPEGTKESSPCIPSWDSNAAHESSYWSSTVADRQHGLKYPNLVPYDNSYSPSHIVELSTLFVRCVR